MSQSFNLNIDEYDIKELEGLLSLSFPYTPEDVKICGQKMKAQLFADPNLKETDRDKVVLFIENATKQLKGRLTTSVLEPQLKKNEIMDSNGHMLIVPPKDRMNKPSGKWGGTVNPFSTTIWANSDKMINRILNVDSLFRENYYTTKSTDFRFNLPEPMKNVVSMSLAALELPLSIYAISADLGNNYFRIGFQKNTRHWKVVDGKWEPHGPVQVDISGETYIILPDGNYTDAMIECGGCDCTDKGAVNPASMAWELNFQLARPYVPIKHVYKGTGGTGGLVQATIDQRTGRVIFGGTLACRKPDPGTAAAAGKKGTASCSYVTFQLYFNAKPPIGKDLVGEDNRTGAPDDIPLQQKLGWTLGFRFGVYVGNNAYASEGRYDFRGPRYLYLVVDDHNNNHIANHIVGVFSDSMTPARQNILARLSWKQYSYFSTNNLPLDRSMQSSVARNYFGPVNIQNLHIKLIDQFGRVVSLNNMDFAMALNFSILYG